MSPASRRRVLPLVLGLVLALLGTVAAEPAWRAVTFRGIPPTRFSEAQPGLFEIAAPRGSGMYVRELSAAERSARALSWSWMVEQGPPATDLARTPGDDRALSVTVNGIATGLRNTG